MTRVNVVPVQELTNLHLMAEYREITRIFPLVRARVTKGHKVEDLKSKPSHYTLGTGHCLFFYDKLGYIYDRYVELKDELLERGYNLNLSQFDTICSDALSIDSEWFGDYTPDSLAIYKNRVRISDRLEGRV